MFLFLLVFIITIMICYIHLQVSKVMGVPIQHPSCLLIGGGEAEDAGGPGGLGGQCYPWDLTEPNGIAWI